MIIDSFEWDDVNVEHIARHQVSPDEVEEVFDSRHYLAKTWSGRYMVFGQSAIGRYLICIFEPARSKGQIRVVTARDMDQSERRLYRNKVKP